MQEEKEIIEKQPSKIKRGFKIVGIIFLVLFILFGIYIYKIEPKMFLIKEQAIIDADLPTEFNGFKIVHFSDIHYGSTINDKELNTIVKKINALKPDVIVFTGDLFDNSINMKEENYESLKNILSHFEASLKKYAVLGDSDYLNKEKYIEIMESASFQVLQNENDLLYYKGVSPILFIGTSSSLEKELDLESAISKEENALEYFKIWLHHEPIIFEDILEQEIRPNVLFTGHTLGNLIKTPFGALLTQEGVSKYQESYYHKKKVSMYISNGLGTYKYPVRFLNPPTISLYRLYRE